MAIYSYSMNRRRDLVKLLYWDRRRLRAVGEAAGTRPLRCRANGAGSRPGGLALLLEGVQVRVLVEVRAEN